MFNQLTSRFQQAFRNLTGRGRLTESNISDAMAEIRRALLEADVNYEVVKSFMTCPRAVSWRGCDETSRPASKGEDCQ